MLFKKAVNDIFFVEPTSVSRWFPARPMGRKSLGGQGLAQMLMTGHAVFMPIMGKKGFAGAFIGFDTQKAPYWHVVQYGFHGTIEPTTSPFLTLKDPDPAMVVESSVALRCKVETGHPRRTAHLHQ
jgi:hypothetical protein